MNPFEEDDFVDTITDADDDSTEIKEFAKHERKSRDYSNNRKNKIKGGFGSFLKAGKEKLSNVDIKSAGSNAKKFASVKIKSLYDYFMHNKLKCLKVAAIVVVAFIVFIILAVSISKNVSSRRIIEMANNSEFAIDSIPEITEVIREYYAAIIDADTAKLETILDDMTGINEEGLQQTLVEGYKNIKCFITDGLKDNEYAVFVYWDVKIINIDTLAPGVTSMYIKYDKADKAYKIVTNIESDENIRMFFENLANNAEIKTLFDSTDKQLEKALASDPSLKLVYDAMSASMEKVDENAADDTKVTKETKDSTETKESTEKTETTETTETTAKAA